MDQEVNTMTIMKSFRKTSEYSKSDSSNELSGQAQILSFYRNSSISANLALKATAPIKNVFNILTVLNVKQ